MSNEVTLFGTEDFDAIAALTGAFTGGNTLIPRLRINYNLGEDEDKPLPLGTYVVTQDTVAVYAKTILFRPFLNAFQYVEYDPATNTYPNKSVIIKKFTEEAFDELGGLACGKVKAADKGLLSGDELIRQKKIKCNRILYGTATLIDAVDGDKAKQTVKDIPVVWRMASSNFNAPKQALDIITSLKHQYFHHQLKLSLKREKQGSTIYYLSLVEPNLADMLSFSAEDMSTFRMFQETIDRENKSILNKWKASKKGSRSTDDLIDVSKELELNDPMPAF